MPGNDDVLRISQNTYLTLKAELMELQRREKRLMQLLFSMLLACFEHQNEREIKGYSTWDAVVLSVSPHYLRGCLLNKQKERERGRWIQYLIQFQLV